MNAPRSRRRHLFATAGISLLLAACGTANGADRAWTYDPVSGEWGFHSATAQTAATTATVGAAASGESTPSASSAPAAGATALAPSATASIGSATAATGSATAARTASAPASASVSIVDYAFKAAKVTVRAGGRVSWRNTGSDKHNIQFDDGSESPVLDTGASYSRSFSTPGSTPTSAASTRA